MKQYPDTITYQPSALAVKDANGNMVAGSVGVPVSSPCRYEAASGNGTVQGVDGSRVNYTALVYLPKDCPKFPEGAEVTVTINREGIEGEIHKDKVLRFHRGQLNARLWL